ncbi:sporulation protein [Nocardia jejuensis]|uniref:sporulation protein n=1 Tax=Nocardia jejuensis TaxID=328049 RepID=UPI00082D0D26|nr:sporulation protein [Nocardia jejuensis]
MFKKLLAAAGVGGAEVETELHTPGVQPGGTVHGVVRVRGGSVPQEISRIGLEFVTKVEYEHTEEEYEQNRGFAPVTVHGPFHLPTGAVFDIPFAIHAPWETPITFYNGHHLPGMAVSVRTIVEIAGAVDAGDSDPIGVGALPVQHVVLAAMEQLGFRLRRADVEQGWIRGIQQELGFYQEIEFARSPRYPGIGEVEVTFVAGQDGAEVVLEVDRSRGDGYLGFYIDHSGVDGDWTAEIDRMISGIGH